MRLSWKSLPLVCAAGLLCLRLTSAAKFTATTPLPDGFIGHALISTQGHLYHLGGLGGVNGILSAAKVYYAPILSPGQVGAWKAGADLPEASFFHTAAAWGKTIYVIGGQHYTGVLKVSDTVYYSRVSDDGSPGAWQTANNPLPRPLFLHSAAIWEGTLYVTGGWTDSLSNAVYSAEIRSDGSLGSWTTRKSLPVAVYTHPTLQDGTLYVLGGVINGGTDLHSAVYHARIQPDKSLSDWATTTPLVRPLSSHASVVARGRVYVLGGWTGTQPTTETHSAPISTDKTLGDWKAEPSLPVPLYLHAATEADGVIYVTGGSNAQTPQSAVYSLILPEPAAPPDATPPQSTLEFGSPSKWLFGSVLLTPETLLTLTAEDPVSAGVASGLSRILYTIDGGPERVYTGALRFDLGQHTLTFGAVDNAGNREPVRSVTLLSGPFLSDSLDGYDSVNLSGNAAVVGSVRTNGVFTAAGKATVDGDVTAHSAVIGSQSRITGTVTERASTLSGPPSLQAMRAWASAHSDNASVPVPLSASGALVLDSKVQVTLPAGNYIFSELSVTGGAGLSVSGPVNVFLTGPLKVSGGGTLNETGSAEDLWIVSDHVSATVTGNGRAAFSLFAPATAVKLSGNGQMAGRFLGRSIAVAGNGVLPSNVVLSASKRGPVPPRPNSGVVTRSHKKAVSRPLSPPPFHISQRVALGLVSSKGGVVRTAHRAAVKVPSGATAGVNVSVAVDRPITADERKRRDGALRKGSLVSVGAEIEFGPEGTRFDLPVTLELPYDPAQIPAGGREADLQVHYWNAEAEAWEALASRVDKEARVVRTETLHFSLYRVLSGGDPAAAVGGLSFGSVYAFPNPALRGRGPTLHVEAGAADRLDIRIFDLSGELVHSTTLTGPPSVIDDGSGRGPVPAFEYTWDVSGVGSGVYIYALEASKAGAGSIRKLGKAAVLK